MTAQRAATVRERNEPVPPFLSAPPCFPSHPQQVSEPPDYSLVLGGPLFQLYRKAHLSGGALELLWRRILVISLSAWLPLLFLSTLEGHALHGSIRIPFLYDVEVYARFLVALPVLIAAELVVHRRVTGVVSRFVERRIVGGDDLPKFDLAIRSALRLRNSVALELMLLVLVFTLGHWVWRSQVALGAATWYASPDPAHLNLTLAGYWYCLVSIPIFQFIMFRWTLRLGLWFRLLWQISKLNLHLTGAHPDRSGGIGFLGATSYAFGPILFAQGTLLSGMIANRVLYFGQSLVTFKLEAAGLIVALVLLVLGPLVMYAPALERAKRQALAEFGLLANRYVFGFEEKWIRRGAPDTADLLGTGDIQSLADLGNSYSVIADMRLVPFGIKDVTRLAAATAAPLLPLALTTFSLDELVTRLFKVIF